MLSLRIEHTSSPQEAMGALNELSKGRNYTQIICKLQHYPNLTLAGLLVQTRFCSVPLLAASCCRQSFVLPLAANNPIRVDRPVHRVEDMRDNEGRRGARRALRGFDVYVNMVLEDVTEYEITPEGRCITKLDQILLNGNNIAIVCQVMFTQLFPEYGYSGIPTVKTDVYSFRVVYNLLAMT